MPLPFCNQSMSNNPASCSTIVPPSCSASMIVTTDASLSRELLAAKARELGVPELAVPRKIHRVDSLPLLGTGKIDYVTLKRLAEGI